MLQLVGSRYIYNGYSIVVDVCVIVKLVLDFSVFFDWNDTARMQTGAIDAGVGGHHWEILLAMLEHEAQEYNLEQA